MKITTRKMWRPHLKPRDRSVTVMSEDTMLGVGLAVAFGLPFVEEPLAGKEVVHLVNMLKTTCVMVQPEDGDAYQWPSKYGERRVGDHLDHQGRPRFTYSGRAIVATPCRECGRPRGIECGRRQCKHCGAPFPYREPRKNPLAAN